MQGFLSRLTIPGFNVTRFFAESETTSLPNIGIAFSGGGYRALLNGAGAFSAFDERTTNSTKPGHLGGLLQATTYMSGLSGGSWLVGSIYTNNFTTVTALQNANTSGVWDFDRSVLNGPAGDAGYFRQIRQTVEGKEKAGFPVSITDYWYVPIYLGPHKGVEIVAHLAICLPAIPGDQKTDNRSSRGRGLSYQLINATEGGSAYTWSSIASTAQFADGNVPLPIIVALERAPSEQNLSK